MDRHDPEQYIQALAKAHDLRVYDVLGGSADAYGFILSDGRLTKRQLESIEAP